MNSGRGHNVAEWIIAAFTVVSVLGLFCGMLLRWVRDTSDRSKEMEGRFVRIEDRLQWLESDRRR